MLSKFGQGLLIDDIVLSQEVGQGVEDTCVLAQCGNISSGNCDPSNQPKDLSMGVLIDNATKCGCPQGMTMQADKLTCAYPPCNDGGTTVANGVCSARSIGMECVNGQLAWNASFCPCHNGLTQVGQTCVQTCWDGTLAGNCSSTLPEECVNGYLIDNATDCGCPQGEVAVGTECGNASATSGINDITPPAVPLGSNQTAASNILGGTGSNCCCFPTMLAGIAGGYVFFRKKE